MAQKGKPRKRGPRRAYWCYDDVADGRERRGWIASDLYVIGCHRTNAHRPCFREFELLRRTCPGCEKVLDVVEIGYQAVYRDDGYPMLLTLLEHSHEEVSKLRFGTPVRWSRRGGVGEPVALLPRPDGPHWKSTLLDRQHAADLVEFLSHLWGYDEILPHVRSYFETSDNAVSLPPPSEPVLVSRGLLEDEKAMLAAHAKLKTAGEVTDTLVAQFRARGGSVKPSTNGHKKS